MRDDEDWIGECWAKPARPSPSWLSWRWVSRIRRWLKSKEVFDHAIR